jgi:hypothetical protein
MESPSVPSFGNSEAFSLLVKESLACSGAAFVISFVWQLHLSGVQGTRFDTGNLGGELQPRKRHTIAIPSIRLADHTDFQIVLDTWMIFH